MMNPSVKLGVDILLHDPTKYVDSFAIGLVTNHTGVTSNLTSTIEAFKNHPDIDLRAIFGPEHGFRGDLQDARHVDDQMDNATGLPVYSLYGKFRKPTKDVLDDVDVLIFDIQDVGARFYTYISTMTYSMEAAAKHDVLFTVLDRPNPINGVTVEGNLLEPGFESFVGLHKIPIRHGMTIGELALLINRKIGVETTVVRMEGWKRGMWFDDTGLFWVQPSPNIPTLESAIVYPGTCLFEGVNISEGRGTTRPFECIGAPWIEGNKWSRALNELKIEGVKFRACHFTPIFSKYSGKLCSGVQLHITNRDEFEPIKTALHMLSKVLRLWPDHFDWLPPKKGRCLHFDLLAGSDKIRKALGEGAHVEDLIDSWKEELNGFIESRNEHLLYPIGGF